MSQERDNSAVDIVFGSFVTQKVNWGVVIDLNIRQVD